MRPIKEVYNPDLGISIITFAGSGGAADTIPHTPKTNVVRLAGWPSRLAAFLDVARRRVLDWGTFDCCLMAADAIRVQTGVDVAASFRATKSGRRRYTTAKGAVTALRRYLNRDPVTGQYGDWQGRPMGDLIEALAERIADQHGFAEVPVLMAQRGDVVLVDAGADADGQAGRALGVCIGARVAVLGLDGFGYVPLRGCLRAWRVGVEG